MSCRHWCYNIFPPPWSCPDRSVAPFECHSAGAHEDCQALYQKLSSGSSDKHFLRSWTLFGKGEREILQVHIGAHFTVLSSSSDAKVEVQDMLSVEIRHVSFTLSHVYKAIITNILWYKTNWRQVLRKSPPGNTNRINLYIVQVLFIPYFFTCSDCAPANCSAKGKDDALAQKLWELSCKILSITWEWGTLNK